MDPENNFRFGDYNDKLLVNGLLFVELRGYGSIDDKLRNIKETINKGANVNASDANDGNNTPLHIAVEKDEPYIVEFLLKMGANFNAKNIKKQTPLDLATLSDNKNKTEVINILETTINSIQTFDKESNYIKLSKNKTQNKSKKVESVKVIKETALSNESRSGTAGISGQLYETKLLGLLLHRALNDHDIDEFYLGSNIEDLGALDDIVFKYYLKGDSSPKIFFIQAKHKDCPTKNYLTVDSVLKSNNDFSLDKYFESYINIRKKIKHNKCRNYMFQNDFHELDCSFIIYTPAVENFSRKKEAENKGKETLLLTNDKEPFMFNYNDDNMDVLLKKTVLSRTKALAIAFVENINTQKYKNMMWNELIKVYHVFLAQNVVEIIHSNRESEDFIMGRFCKSFLESQNGDEISALLKKIMFQKLKPPVIGDSDEITFEFKLPKNFGNKRVSFDENDYDDLCKIIQKLIKHGNMFDNTNTVVVVDNMVGTDKLIRKKDITLIGNLVGETLILDNETGFLKFNTENSSSEITRTLLERLKKNNVVRTDLKGLRLDITVKNFPQLSLSNEKYLKHMLADFLNRFKFYTNQANEEGVEEILKREIIDRFKFENKNTENFYCIKGDAIYLQYHDKIQKWWKNPKKNYLTKSCKYYEEAKRDILDSPLLNTLSYVYIKKISDFKLYFDETAVGSLGLQEFLNISNAKVFHIITKDKFLTSIKITQYFRNIEPRYNYKFIDLNVVTTEDYNKFLVSEMSDKVTDIIIIILSDTSNNLTYLNIQDVQSFVNKLIVISHSASEYLTKNFKCFEKIDQNNSISDFDKKTKLRIFQSKSILFQGSLASFVSIIDENMHCFVKEKVLHKLLNNTVLKIGREPTNITNYCNNKEGYIERNLCRCIELNEEQNLNEFKCFSNPKDLQKAIKDRNIFENNKDICVISNDNTTFEEACKELNSVNIHWFCKKDGNFRWMKSNGNLQNLFQFVKRVKCKKESCLLEPKSLKHVHDRVVILSAGPGMGKSTLLTHLMMQTKHFYKSICVLKLNLLDLKHEFSIWQRCDVKMRLKWILSILYKSFSYYECENLSEIAEVNLRDAFIDKQTCFNSSEALSNKYEIAFEFKLFLNLYNNGKICLILDGFDEICPDYKQEALEFLKLLRNSQIHCLWISCRSYVMINELERELNTFAFTLKSFTAKEQIGFVEKFWGINCYQSSFSHSHFENIYVAQFLDAISRKIGDFNKDFTGIPLHLRMIAETYQEYFKPFYFAHAPLYNHEITPDNIDLFQAIITRDAFDYLLKLGPVFNLITLYEKFIETKFYKIRFGEKRNCLCSKDPDIKMIIDKERRLFFENHKKIAAYALLNNENEAGILTEDDKKDTRDLIQRFNLGKEKTGIIGKIYQNEPRFVHFTYAEYFACEFLCDKLRQNTELIWKYFINHILVMDNRGIIGFIDSKLENDHRLSNLTSKFVSDALLMQRHSSKSALYSAALANNNNIVFFLLNNLDTYLDKDILDDFIHLVKQNFFLSINNRQSDIILSKIINIIKRLDCNKLVQLFFNKNIPFFNLFMLAFLHRKIDGKVIYGSDKDNADKLLEHLNPEDLTMLLTVKFWYYEYTILHILLLENKNLNVLKYVVKLNQEQRFKIFCARDKANQVPAHVAARMNNYDFFEIMANLVGDKQFKTICNLKDEHGLIPLINFNLDSRTSDEFRTLFAKSGVGIASRGNNGWFWYNTENPEDIYLVHIG